jgi:hypothetical protein
MIIITKAASHQLFRANGCSTTPAEIAQSIQHAYHSSPPVHTPDIAVDPPSRQLHQQRKHVAQQDPKRIDPAIEPTMAFYQGEFIPYKDYLLHKKLQELHYLLRLTSVTESDKLHLLEVVHFLHQQVQNPTGLALANKDYICTMLDLIQNRYHEEHLKTSQLPMHHLQGCQKQHSSHSLSTWSPSQSHQKPSQEAT